MLIGRLWVAEGLGWGIKSRAFDYVCLSSGSMGENGSRIASLLARGEDQRRLILLCYEKKKNPGFKVSLATWICGFCWAWWRSGEGATATFFHSMLMTSSRLRMRWAVEAWAASWMGSMVSSIFDSPVERKALASSGEFLK